MAENNWNAQATFIYIKKEVEKLAMEYNLSTEQREQLEMSIAQKLGASVVLCQVCFILTDIFVGICEWIY